MSLALSTQKTEDLPAKVAQQQAQIRWLELRVKDLETQLFGKKPEKRSGSGDDGNLQWDELLGEVRVGAGPRAAANAGHRDGAEQEDRLEEGAQAPGPGAAPRGDRGARSRSQGPDLPGDGACDAGGFRGGPRGARPQAGGLLRQAVRSHARCSRARPRRPRSTGPGRKTCCRARGCTRASSRTSRRCTSVSTSPTTGWRNSWSGSGWTCRASARSR